MAEKSDRAKKEEATLAFWKEKRIFEKTLEQDAPKGEFVFYDGPPFATGLPHYGHILPGTIKDVIPRYKTMRGYHVSRRWGWDCHGLPVENLVEKELGLETKKDIEKYGIAEFNRRARESVLRYEKEWKEIIPRTGRWIDMDHAYKTMDPSYTESVWWSFKQLFDKGLVYQGFKSMHLCPHCETTLSNFEVNQGYKDIVDISVYAKFELVEEPGTFILAWTTTPWTLPGNVALAVNPDIIYVRVQIADVSYLLAKDRLSVLAGTLYQITSTIKGSDLVGLRYKTLFNYYFQEGKVYAADFVTAEDGTGVVHIAPGFGEDDYNLSLKENLPFVQHVNIDGTFKSEVKDFAGRKVKPKDDHQSADVEIIKYLAGKNLLFGKEKITHSYPHCWRCDTPLLNYATSSWFVKVTEIKDKLVKNNEKVNWMPQEIGEGRFGKWLEGARDWAVSRSRFWGAPLPVWQTKDGGKKIVVDSLETLKRYSKGNGNTFIFVRHGGAESNAQNICNSDQRKPYHLTTTGREQARQAAKKVGNIDALYLSPFVRTKETAEIIANHINFDITKAVEDERLGEFNFGDFDGKSFNDYLAFEEKNIPAYDSEVPGGESYLEAKRRFGHFLYEVDQKHKGERILVVTHGIGLEAVTALLEGADMKRSKEIIDTLAPEPGQVMHFEFTPLPHNENFELDLHRPYIDDVVFTHNGEEYKRVPEVFDTWYDSGSVPFASRNTRELVQADFIAEGLDQTRGWFYTMAVLGTALFGQSPYKQVVVNGLILAEDGKKMSKRLGNYPELSLVLDKYGADALRYFLLSSAAVRAQDLAFSEKGLDEVVKKHLNRLENVVSFFELYKGTALPENSGKHVLDRWIDMRLSHLKKEVNAGLEAYELDRATRPFADFIDDLSTWYLRRSRTRPEALTKLHDVLLELSILLAPFVPFIAEDIYQRLGGTQESVHLEKWPEEHISFWQKLRGKNDEVLECMLETRRIISLALELRNKATIKVRQPLQKLMVKQLKLSPEYLEIIKDEINVKEIVHVPTLESELALDVALTPDLLEEGRVRDIIRAVQEWRKEHNLKPGEVARYTVSAGEEEFFARHAEEIKKATRIEF